MEVISPRKRSLDDRLLKNYKKHYSRGGGGRAAIQVKVHPLLQHL